MKDLYAVLGVQRGATPEQVKAAYRKLSKRHHPDRDGDPQKFREVQEAYEVLGDQERRSAYDAGEWCGAKGSLRERAESALCEAFSILAGNGNIDLDCFDIVAAVRKEAEKQLRAAVEQGVMAQRKAEQLEQAVKRVRHTSGTGNFVSRLFAAKAQDARANKAKLVEKEGLLKEMLEVLGEFGYDADESSGWTKPPSFVQDIRFSIYGR